ncbi:type II secretion system minor pseudopilin GspH [Photobacterium leiognathi]|uniref:Type II secretion system protein H n=1 Tax=Photobacterium leiognathi subsp. mandapamensis TaxID=48408 RepID=A0A2T3KST6_PHOLD|nr:type II secretion system minor pseudopilin GspH [Photobacterium leiognathi]PHZ59622.1 type II secretion system protein GspH [Photobacterium leiognathi]PSU99113.1 type II secretion system protein GspH [Photobacterium leiognathi subsp. mandapamensis]PSV09526.1 type II secretion system protein GspH [Photobacterium leiognathi subsp. mandapamensis]PSW42237.1 type II secretion system protein GspH [Photobacterium leiognathi subsp. mandapamensis]PSW51770.1 type II secretion system protein GspH [Pho
MKRSAGFTLIEIMLVLVLLATSAVAVISTLPDNKRDEVKEQAVRFHHLAQLLGEDAMLNGVDYGIRVEPHQYHFVQLTQDGWQPLEGAKFYTDVKLDKAITTNVEIGGAWKDKDRLFKSDSLFKNEDLFTKSDEEKKKIKPQIVVMASGEYTPFTLSFEVDGENQFWRVSADEVGNLVLLQPGETLEQATQREK